MWDGTPKFNPWLPHAYRDSEMMNKGRFTYVSTLVLDSGINFCNIEVGIT